MKKTNAATGGKPLGLYLHIPFCVKKCAYCDFYSITDASLKADYTAALIRDIKAYGERCSGYTVDTVYIGGGTPTFLTNDELTLMMETLTKRFRSPRAASSRSRLTRAPATPTRSSTCTIWASTACPSASRTSTPVSYTHLTLPTNSLV